MQWLGDDAVPSWLRFTEDGGAARASVSAGGDRESVVFGAGAAAPHWPADVVGVAGHATENDSGNVASSLSAELLNPNDAKTQAAAGPSLSKEQTRQYNK